jgi:hypothetical protein
MSMTGFTGGLPTGFRYEQVTSGGAPSGNGNGSITDTNGDGAFDSMTGSGTQGKGTPVSFTIGFTSSDVTGDNNPDYLSIPWSQASAVGVRFNDSCTVAGSGGTDPQVWIPLADSDGDNRPDAIVLDLNGNGAADPEFFRSPRVVAPTPTPSMNTWTLGVLLALLMLVGWWSLRQRTTIAS